MSPKNSIKLNHSAQCLIYRLRFHERLSKRTKYNANFYFQPTPKKFGHFTYKNFICCAAKWEGIKHSYWRQMEDIVSRNANISLVSISVMK